MPFWCLYFLVVKHNNSFQSQFLTLIPLIVIPSMLNLLFGNFWRLSISIVTGHKFVRQGESKKAYRAFLALLSVVPVSKKTLECCAISLPSASQPDSSRLWLFHLHKIFVSLLIVYWRFLGQIFPGRNLLSQTTERTVRT